MLISLHISSNIYRFHFKAKFFKNTMAREEIFSVNLARWLEKLPTPGIMVNGPLIDLYRNYCGIINIDILKSDIHQGFHQLREKDLSGNSQQTTEIIVDLHYLCKTNKNADSKENEISQSELKQKIATVAKYSRFMKFFEENQCSVCLSSYIEILDDNLHILVPFCGHPLCCRCAGKILMSENIECPRCRGYITADSFNFMKFNVVAFVI